MNNGYVINVTAVDRPGIVAGVSSAIVSLDGNISSCSQTVLDGYFTLIMTFSMPEQMDPESLKEIILREPRLEGCQAILFPASISEVQTVDANQNIYVITAFGKDCKGIVSQFTRYLGDKEINIVDLYGNITHDGEFLLIGQVEVNPDLDLQNIQYDLEAMGEQVGFTVRIQHNNVFVATNHIRLDR
ncbi:MAG: hypothetical protein J6X44_13320 [Thermoguttaceae bacterium]|nr:hypothetical protein [Thermoguttaceae bacterium]